MTVCLDHHEGNGKYVNIKITEGYGSSIYVVTVYPVFDGYIGRPEREKMYPMSEKKKALATYKRYIKKYCE